jgi:hypothetical protein
MDDLTKELWQGVTERVVHHPEPVNLPSLLVAEPPRPVADQTGWREFLVSPKLGAMLAVACVLGLLGIFSAHPFASASVSERVSDKLGHPATCTEVGATASADSRLTIHRCAVSGTKAHGAVQCFAVSDGDIRQLSGRDDLGC